MTLQERLAPGKYRLRVDDYLMLAEAGAFGDARSELIEGEVFVVSPQYLPHGVVKAELYDQLRDFLRASGSSWRILSEVSVELSTNDMPLPDIVLVTDARGQKAAPLATVRLVVEVSATTLHEDLGVKQRLYARQGVPEYWVADVDGRVIHRMSTPAGDTYADREIIQFGQPITSATIANLTIATDAL